MVRVQIEITDAQAKTLDEIASAEGVSVPELIQIGLVKSIASTRPPSI